MQTKTVISQIASFPHGVGVWISLNIESEDIILSSAPLTMHTIGADRPALDQLVILNEVIVAKGWPALSAEQVMRIEALRAVASATDSDIATLAGKAAVAATKDLAMRNAALEAQLSSARSAD